MNRKVLFLSICLILFLAAGIIFDIGLVVSSSVLRASEGKEEAFNFQEIKSKEDHRIIKLYQDLCLPSLTYLTCPAIISYGIPESEDINLYHYLFSSFSNHSPPVFA